LTAINIPRSLCKCRASHKIGLFKRSDKAKEKRKRVKKKWEKFRHLMIQMPY